MAWDRTDQNAPEQEKPTVSGAVRPLRTDEVRQTLAVSLGPVVDEIRQLATDFGIRPYRVFLIHVRWSGGKIGVGTPQEISRREILPTPKVRDMTNTVEVLSAFGRLEEGAVAVEKISAKWSEDDLLGKTPDLTDPAVPRAGRHECDFFWEIQENRGVIPPPVPRQYVPGAVPTLSRGGMAWRITLTKRAVNRSRQQTFDRGAG